MNSIVNDKKSIINEISVLSSIGKTAELPDQNFTFPSVNIKNEPIPFMLDLLTACIGSEALQRTTGQIITNFIRNVEPDLKSNIKKQSVTFNSDKQLPTLFSTTGYEIPTKKIDLFSNLKTDPSSSEGLLLYQNNVNSFDQKAYNAIINPNTDVVFGNMKMNYNDITDNMTIKPVNPTDTIGTFINDYIDNITIIDEKQFTSQVMEAMYGTISNSTKKPLNSILEEEKVRNLINKIVEDGNVANITDEELEQIQRIASNKLNSIIPVDVGCSIIDSVLFLTDINSLINATTGNTDPIAIGSAFEKVMNDTFGRIPQQTNPTNKNAIRDGYFKLLIKTITNAIVIALTSTPQIRVLITMVNGFKNNDNVAFPNNISDDINSLRNYINCIGKSAGSLISEFIFNLLKVELLKIIIPVTRLIIKEKLEAFIRIIQSLF